MSALLLLGLAGCSPERPVETPPATVPVEKDGESQSPSARPELHAALVEDGLSPRHPSDGGGSLRVVVAPAGPVEVGSLGRWVIELTVGPLGISQGGGIYLQVPPFWGWSSPDTSDAGFPGYTRITTSASDVTLDPMGSDQGLLALKVNGGPLAAGETVTFDYGAEGAGAGADRYVERGERFWVAVDGDGDGVRALVTGGDAPVGDTIAGPAALVSLLGPSTARPGQRVRMALAILDAQGNRGAHLGGTLNLEVVEGTATLEARKVDPGSSGTCEVFLATKDEGVVRVAAKQKGRTVAVSNPLLVSGSAPRWVWGDLHGHSQLSDGTGTPEDYFAYAHDVAALDVSALTDHDHWGLQPLATTPENWQRIRDAVQHWNEPGTFVTVLGYEWTSWLHGHRHVLWFSDDDPDRQRIYDSTDPATQSPVQLWNVLRGTDALTFAHHSAGGPIATNWSIPPDRELEPVTEVASVHGQSESPDGPGVIYDAVPHNFVRDALDKGYELGFIGSGDTHDGHPGLAHLAAGLGGLAAIQTDTLDRASIKKALLARRVYATNGPRIILRTTLDGAAMGSQVGAGSTKKLVVFAVAPEPLARLEIVRSGQLATLTSCSDLRCSAEAAIPNLAAGEYLYVRAIQQDGGAAWSSPFFVGP